MVFVVIHKEVIQGIHGCMKNVRLKKRLLEAQVSNKCLVKIGYDDMDRLRLLSREF